MVNALTFSDLFSNIKFATFHLGVLLNQTNSDLQLQLRFIEKQQPKQSSFKLRPARPIINKMKGSKYKMKRSGILSRSSNATTQ